VNKGRSIVEMMTADTQSVRAEFGALLAQQNRNGGWGYRPGLPTAAEPTALAALAIATQPVHGNGLTTALKALTPLQRPDGAVCPLVGLEHPGWPTPLAIMAWSADTKRGGGEFREPARRAVAWLLSAHGEPAANAPGVLGHDTKLIGWSWVAGTHSWVEPTAYAVMALRAVGKDGHPRAKEAVRLLLDRAIPGGGFNYGNSRVLGSALRPFPATTGIALAALAGQPRNPAIEESIGYLRDAIGQVSAPYSLAWGLIGLRCWDAISDATVVEALARGDRDGLSAVDAALYLLARSDSFPMPKVRIHDG